MNRRKKQYRGNNFIASERAVALSLGFVMLAGICITAFCLVMAASLPFWTKTFEAAHASAVADEFCDLATEINGTITVAKRGGQNAAGTSVIKMKPDRVPVIGISPPGSCLEVRPDSDQLNITPYVSAASTPLPGVPCFWVENTTANFSHANATRVKVLVSQNTIALSRVDIEGDLILDNTATALSGAYNYDNIELTNGSTVNLVFGNYLKLYANSIFIDATSRIIGDDSGVFGGDGGRNGIGAGYGSFGYNGSGGGGAGHNGSGGDGGQGGFSPNVTDVGLGGITYGSNSYFFIDFGSGGGGGAYGLGRQGATH